MAKEKDSVNCSICNEDAYFWNTKNSYNIYKCNNCGFAQVRPVLKVTDIREIYTNFGHNDVNIKSLSDIELSEKEYPNSTLDAERIVKKVIQYNILNRRKVLDIGAGYGFFTKEFLKNGFLVDAIELAENEQRIFKELNSFTPHRCTFEEYNTSDTYTTILMSQILEHVRDPEEWIKKSNNLLEKGGLLVLALPHFDSIFRYILQKREPFICPPFHLNYFNKKSLTVLLKRNGFKIIKFHTISRIPFKRIFKRYKIPRIITSIVSGICINCLNLIDIIERGSMINVYAIKVHSNS